jgi:hypothetical protein
MNDTGVALHMIDSGSIYLALAIAKSTQRK